MIKPDPNGELKYDNKGCRNLNEEAIIKKDWNYSFFEGMQNRIIQSHYKYGDAETNYKNKMVNALESAKLCMEKYEKTHNTEYLMDAANYLMFEFSWPWFDDAFFKATSSEESAGTVGEPYNVSLRKAGLME